MISVTCRAGGQQPSGPLPRQGPRPRCITPSSSAHCRQRAHSRCAGPRQQGQRDGADCGPEKPLAGVLLWSTPTLTSLFLRPSLLFMRKRVLPRNGPTACSMVDAPAAFLLLMACIMVERLPHPCKIVAWWCTLARRAAALAPLLFGFAVQARLDQYCPTWWLPLRCCSKAHACVAPRHFSSKRLCNCYPMQRDCSGIRTRPDLCLHCLGTGATGCWGHGGGQQRRRRHTRPWRRRAQRASRHWRAGHAGQR